MSGINLEEKIAQLEFKYGGVLQKLAELHDAVVNQLEEVKTAGVKIRREKTSYISGTVLACVGRNNGNKFLKAQNTGTTAEGTKDESFYDSLAINDTWNDGGVTWKVVEDAFTSGSIVSSAINASHAEIADYASSAGSASSASWASSAGYIGPFHVNGGEVWHEPVISSGVEYNGISITLQDDTRPLGTAGVIVNGINTYPVPSSGGFLPNGKILYLHGSSAVGGTPSYDCWWFLDGKTPPATMPAGEFLTALAKNEGGKVIQIQYGDIVTPWPGDEGGDEYGGPFKVFITGSTTTTNEQTNETTTKYDFELYDPTSPINPNTNKHEWGGKVFAGENYYQAGITSGFLNAGDYLYLVGDSKSGDVSFKYTNYIPEVTLTGATNSDTGRQTITSAGFYVRIAKCEGASVTQIQHGDITVPPWKVAYADYAALAYSATYATYAEAVDYKGPFHVVQNGAYIQIVDDTFPGQYGGAVIIGNSGYRIGSANNFSLENGFRLYLQGTSSYDGNVTLEYRKIADGATITPLKQNQFLFPLAFKLQDKITQVQFGNIEQPFHTEEYQGPFKVAITGSTTTTENETTTTTYDISIRDTVSTTNNKAGKVFDGSNSYEVDSSSISLEAGEYIYLKGSSAAGNITFEFTNTSGTPSTSLFFTRLAKNQGGKIAQIHEGDIVVPWNAGTAKNVDYNGPFKVSITGSTTTTENEGLENETNTTTYDISIIDATSAAQNPINQKAGRVFDGLNSYEVASSAITVNDGDFIYFRGSITANFTRLWDFTTTSGTPSRNLFFTRLAKNEGGKIIQIHEGDILAPWYNLSAGHATEATSALYTPYRGPFHVSLTAQNTVTVFDDVRPTIGGRVIVGSSIYSADSSAGITLGDGYRLYLIGTISNGGISFNYSAANTELTPQASWLFYTQLAYNSGARIFQTQWGDIVQPLPGGGEEYQGPFKVKVDEIDDQTLAVDVTIYDPTDPSTNPYYAGIVFDGSSAYHIESDTLTGIEDGAFIYLNGTSGSDIEFSDIEGTNDLTEFSIKIAQNSGGKIVQIQHGDIYSIPWNAYNAAFAGHATEADSADIADFASSAGYMGPFNVSATAINQTTNAATVTVLDNTRTGNVGGCIVLGNIISSAPSSAGITLSNGYKLYLVGSSGANGYNFSYSANNGSISPATNTFWTQLAYNNGGRVIQTQFGDVVQPTTGVTKISVTGGTVNPSSGIGDVNIIIPPAGAGNILPVNWNVMAGTYLYPTHITGQGKYTTDPDYDDTDPNAEYIKLGEGYGGIIVGWIVAPLDAGFWSQNEYEYNLNIEQSSYSSISIPLLVPESTKVLSPGYTLEQDEDTGEYYLESVASGATGECWTPRKSYVYLPIPPGTYFNLTETGMGFHGSSSLTFYPYIQPS